jgi:hypothetical protein
MSLRIIFNISNIRNIARQLIKTNLMNEISSHRIQEVRVFIYDILIVEEKLVRLQKLLLLNVEDILLNVIPHDLVVFHIIV